MFYHFGTCYTIYAFDSHIFMVLMSVQSVLLEDPGTTMEDVDFCDTHMVLILKEDKKFRICSIPLPLPVDCTVSYSYCGYYDF